MSGYLKIKRESKDMLGYFIIIYCGYSSLQQATVSTTALKVNPD
jgi:hypothetical protein